MDKCIDKCLVTNINFDINDWRQKTRMNYSAESIGEIFVDYSRIFTINSS